jgi:DNA sulfur modification protein DndB
MTDITPHDHLLGQLSKVLESYFAQHYREKCYLGLLLHQGKRKMVQINVPLEDIPVLLQAKHSENNDPDSGKNRPEVPGHAKEVREYVLKRVKKNKPWILGTITANVDPSKITIIHLAREICFVAIPRGVKLDITDGQHRKTAIEELIQSSDSELIGDNDIPLTLVLEGDDRQCQIDFGDMAKSRPLQKTLIVSFSERTGAFGIAKNLADKVPMFVNKVERIKQSPSIKQKHIYSLNFISVMVSAAFSGNIKAELSEINIDEATEALVTCLNQFFGECQQTQYFHETPVEHLTVEQVKQFKENCVLGRSIGLQVLGRLFYETYEENPMQFNSYKVSQLAQIDWSHQGDVWQGNIVVIDPNPKNSQNPYKIATGVSAVKSAVEQVKQRLGWNHPYPNHNESF